MQYSFPSIGELLTALLTYLFTVSEYRKKAKHWSKNFFTNRLSTKWTNPVTLCRLYTTLRAMWASPLITAETEVVALFQDSVIQPIVFTQKVSSCKLSIRKRYHVLVQYNLSNSTLGIFRCTIVWQKSRWSELTAGIR